MKSSMRKQKLEIRGTGLKIKINKPQMPKQKN